ncbi:hypothetical protein WA556_002495 [Blastocystis sp. ATCC 50177/Nand II]
MNASAKLNDAIEKYRVWLLNRYDAFRDELLSLIGVEDKVCQITAFRTAMSFCQKGDYKEMAPSPRFDIPYYRKIVAELLTFNPLPDELRICLKEAGVHMGCDAQEYFEYTDIKYHTINSLRFALTQRANAEPSPESDELEKRVLYVLSLMKTPVDEEVKALGVFPAALAKLVQQKKNFTDLLEEVLRRDLTQSTLEYVLMKMDAEFLPYLASPMQFTDFLTACFDYGGVLSVMSLSSLYEMITHYGVNYPAYFDRLYSLLDEKVFSMKYRQRFLALLVRSLRSSAVPALVLAAFCKRLARIAVVSAPSTALFVVPLLTELVSYHSSLYPLVQVGEKEDVYDVVSVRKMLPGVEEDEVAPAKELEDEDEEESEESEEESEKEEVAAEVDDHRMTERPSAELSSEILKRVLKRMELKRQRCEKEPECPAKQPKVEYAMKTVKEVIRQKAAFDPFDNATNDIQQSHALESYLWELYVLQRHYDPKVVAMMRMLQAKLVKTRQQFNRIVGITYESEFNRLLKEEPGNFAFASRNAGYLSEESVVAKLFI